MLGMLDMQGMQPHNVQEETQSSHPTFQDFQTRKIDVTQKENTREVGNAGNAAKKSKKKDLMIFPKINHQTQILAIPFKYPKNGLPKSR